MSSSTQSPREAAANRKRRALIIGGGIGGLATAIALKQSGLEVEVFERVAVLREVGAGLSLWANAIRALDQLGLGAAIRAQALPETGGGIRTDHTGAVWETALGLPLRAPDGRGGWFSPRFLDEKGHPIYVAGVATDDRMRPIDGDGKVVYANVAVAGAALAGCDPVRERCYSGMALATGWRAGQILSSEL